MSAQVKHWIYLQHLEQSRCGTSWNSALTAERLLPLLIIKSSYGIYKPINSINFSWDMRTESMRWHLIRLAKHSSVGGRDTTARLWDVHTGELLKTFVGHTDRVRLVAYSNDGKTVASAGWKDRTILILGCADWTTSENHYRTRRQNLQSCVCSGQSDACDWWTGLPRYVFGILAPENA